jgi:glycosyltransferase involved in cell wall biosynthesis
LFGRLQGQTLFDFEWIIVDDGSDDETESLVKSFYDNAKFNVKYVKKENGGKHTALNYSHPYIDGDLVFIVDSDDQIVYDAIETIEKDWKKYGTNKNIWGLIYQRGLSPTKKFNETWNVPDAYVGNWIDVFANSKYSGGICEVVRAADFKNYEFPSFTGERFLGECFLWMHLSESKNCIFFNKILYLVNFQIGGLTKSGRALRMKNPNGGYAYAKLHLNKRLKFSIRLKYAILAVCYSRVLRLSIRQLFIDFPNPLLLIVAFGPGMFLRKIWSMR